MMWAPWKPESIPDYIWSVLKTAAGISDDQLQMLRDIPPRTKPSPPGGCLLLFFTGAVLNRKCLTAQQRKMWVCVSQARLYLLETRAVRSLRLL